MEITPYLSLLLFQHDCVIVPGLGGFIASYKKTEFNPQGTYINPARKTIAFNQNLNNNDGLLAHHIAQKASVGFNTALDKINAWVSGLHSKLQQGETITIEGIGTLKLNEEKRIVFSPNADANFLPETYGLGKLSLGTTVSKPIPATSQPVKSEESTPPKTVTTTENSKQLQAAPTIPPPRQKRKTSVLRKIFVAFIILIVISALAILQDFFYHAKISTGSIIPLNGKNTSRSSYDTETVQPQTAEVQKASPLPSESSEKNTDAQPRVDTITPKTSKTDSVYYIIAGAFKSESNAQGLVNALEQKGYEPKIINLHGSSLYRVGYKQYNSRNEAETHLDAVRSQENNSAAWVLAVKQ
ncbi:MAG: SPOR domain-containing protein [Bacteroidota bacterium]|jgi:cell division septation protein DedD